MQINVGSHLNKGTSILSIVQRNSLIVSILQLLIVKSDGQFH